MIKQFRHVGITVQDLSACTDFFKLLGFEVHKDMDEEGQYLDAMLCLSNVKVRTVKLKGPDNNIVELLKFTSHKLEGNDSWNGKIYSTGLTHIAFTVEDLEKTYLELLSKGIEFNAPPQDSPDGYAKVTFCRGPENLLIELVEQIKNG